MEHAFNNAFLPQNKGEVFSLRSSFSHRFFAIFPLIFYVSKGVKSLWGKGLQYHLASGVTFC